MSWRSSERSIFISRIYKLKGEREFRAMEEEVRTALERFPEDPCFEVLLADADWQLGRSEEARLILESLAGKADHLADYHGLWGAVHLSRDDHRAALENFLAANSIQPSTFYQKRQADCLIKLKKFDEALGLLKSLPDVNRDKFALSSLARVYSGLGQTEDALDCYQRILDVDPGNSFAKSRVYALKLSQKPPEQAQAEVKRILRVPSQKRDPAVLQLQADQLKREGRHGEAADVYNQLVTLSSGAEREHYRKVLAFSYYKANLHNEAFPLLLELCRESPGDPYLRTTLSATAQELNRTKEVAGFFFQLARSSPSLRFLFGIAKKLQKMSEEEETGDSENGR